MSSGPERRRIEIVHESLLTSWPRLVRWQTQDADAAQLRDHLRQAAQLWEERGRPEDLLWSGNAYRELSVWRARYPGKLSDREEAFVRAMDLAASRRRRRLRVALAALILITLGIAAVMTMLWREAVLERGTAVAEAQNAEAQKLLALSRLALDDDPTTALAYGTRSIEIADTPEARRFLLEILGSGPVAWILQLRSGGAPHLTFGPDGKWLALLTNQGDDFLIPERGSPVRLEPDADYWGSFTEDGRFLATPSYPDPGKIHLFAVPEAKVVRTFESGGRRRQFAALFQIRGTDLRGTFPSEGGSIDVHAWTLPGGERRTLGRFVSAGRPHDVHPEGTWGVVLGEDNGVYRQPVDGETERMELLWRPTERVTGLTFDAMGNVIAAATETGLELYSVRDRTIQRLVLPAGSRGVRGPLDMNASKIVARPGFDGIDPTHLWAWDLDGPAEAEPVTLSGAGLSAALHPNGRWIATASDEGRVSFWPLPLRPARVVKIPSGEASLRFTPDSRSLVVCGNPVGLRMFPVDPAGTARTFTRPEARCHGLAIDHTGANLLAGGGKEGWAFFLVPLSGASPRQLLEPAYSAPMSPAFHPSGRYGVAFGGLHDRNPMLKVVDLESGVVRTIPVPRPPEDGTREFPIRITGMGFAFDGTLYSAGDGGIRRWDLEAGTSRVIYGAEAGTANMALSGDGKVMLVAVGEGDWIISGELVLFDLVAGTRRRITTHGSEFNGLAVDQTGNAIVTTDAKGWIRVGPAPGEEPHLLMGNPAGHWNIVISPDGRWIASAVAGEIRLWPMPDLSKPPLHTLPREQFVAKLHELTNLRAVPDASSSTGYKLEIGPFPGWEAVPAW